MRWRLRRNLVSSELRIWTLPLCSFALNWRTVSAKNDSRTSAVPPYGCGGRCYQIPDQSYERSLPQLPLRQVCRPSPWTTRITPSPRRAMWAQRSAYDEDNLAAVHRLEQRQSNDEAPMLSTNPRKSA